MEKEITRGSIAHYLNLHLKVLKVPLTVSYFPCPGGFDYTIVLDATTIGEGCIDQEPSVQDSLGLAYRAAREKKIIQ